MTQPNAPDDSEEGDVHRHVPAGTWASESAEAPLEPDQSRERVRSIDGRASGTIPVRELLREAPRSATASASPREAATLPLPPYLASVLLRQRDERRDPIAIGAGRVLAGLGGGLVLGGVASSVALAGGGAIPPMLATAALLALALLVLSLVPLAEPRRSIAMVAVAVPLLVVGLVARADAAGAVASASALATNAGLVLRSRRIGSPAARGLVALGGSLAIGWLVSVGVHGATVASLEPSAFVGPAIALTLVIHLALSLLAFVDDHGSSGAGLIAALGLVWALAEALAAAAGDGLWPLGAAQVSALVPPLALPACAIAIAQVLGGGVPPATRARSSPKAPRVAAEDLAPAGASEQAPRP